MKIPKWQHKLARYYKRRKLVYYFLKQVYMSWIFWRALKLGMSFSLEHFFIALAISTQVASASLKFKVKRITLFKITGRWICCFILLIHIYITLIKCSGNSNNVIGINLYNIQWREYFPGSLKLLYPFTVKWWHFQCLAKLSKDLFYFADIFIHQNTRDIFN